MSEQAERLFDRPEITLETVRVADIEPWSADGAASGVGRSVELFGQLQVPLLYRNDQGKLIVKDGARRLDEFVGRGIDEVQAYVIPADAGEAAANGAALLMHQRSPNPVHEAQYISSLLRSGFSPEELAETFGVPIQKVRKRMKLLSVDRVVIEGVAAGTIAVGTAERLANLTPKQQSEAVAMYVEKGRLLGKDLATITSASRNAALTPLWTEDELPPPPPQSVANNYVRQMRSARIDKEAALRAVEAVYAEAETEGKE